MTLLAHKKRLAALALLAVAALAAHIMILAPLLAFYRSREAHIELLAARASRVISQEANGEVTARRLAAIEGLGEAQAIFWPGATEAVAAAALQEQMRALLTQSGAQIDTTEALPAPPDGTFGRVALKLRFSGDIDQVSRVVHTIETMKPALVIERAVIRLQNSTREDTPALAVELQLFGLADQGMRKEPKT